MNEPSEMHDRAAGSAPLPEPAGSPASAAPEPWSHPWHDQLGLLYHRAIAGKIRAHPDLRSVAAENIVRWTARNDYPASVLRALQHWRGLLTSAPLEELLAALTDPSERGHQMRQNTPFAGILTAEERRRIRDEHEKATTH
jgi:hypothetical protein